MTTATQSSQHRADLLLQIKDLIRSLIRKPELVDNANDNTELEADLDMDSARMVDIVIGLEERFGISIEDDRIDNLKTIGDLVRTVEELMPSREAKLA